MTRYIVHLDVGQLPQAMADARMQKFKEDNLSFFSENDYVIYIANSRGYTAIETFPTTEKQIYFSSGDQTQINELQTQFNEFFGEKTVLVVYHSDFNGVVTKVTV